VQLLPDSQAALDEYLDFSRPDLTEAILALGVAATRVVPDIVALSLRLVDEDLTFTMVDSERLKSSALGQFTPPTSPDPDLDLDALDEQRWQSFARASAAAGIASSISLPVVRNRRVVWGISLYASSPDAFVGHHHELAQVLGAWDAGAVTNADLAFRTRDDAAHAPRQLHEQRIVEVAVGIYAGRYRITVEDARQQLELLAEESGVSLAEAAEQVISGRHIP
jgi:ANTAR domain